MVVLASKVIASLNLFSYTVSPLTIKETYNNFDFLGQTRYQYNASMHNLPKSESSPYLYGEVSCHQKLLSIQESNVSGLSKKSS